MTREEVVAVNERIVRVWERWAWPELKEPPDVQAARATLRMLRRPWWKLIARTR